MKKVNGCTKLMGLVSLGQEQEAMNSLCLKGKARNMLIHCTKKVWGNLHHAVLSATHPAPRPQSPERLTERSRKLTACMYFLIVCYFKSRLPMKLYRC